MLVAYFTEKLPSADDWFLARCHSGFALIG